MKILIFWVCLFGYQFNYAQNPVITGRFVDAITNVPLPQVKIAIEGSFIETFSDAEGLFSLAVEDTSKLELILSISRPTYLSKRLPVQLNREQFDLGDLALKLDPFYERSLQNTISLSDAELLSEEADFDNISGILQSVRDPYLTAAAFDFSQTFYRVRGLGAEQAKLLINGVEMNKFYDGRPQWSNWGGLNDVQRNQVFSIGISPNEVAFGNLGGTTNIIMRASKYQQGGRITFSGSNRSYSGRAMATYASGEVGDGWFYAFSIGRRYAEEGYMEGTPFSGNSVFVSVEKKLNQDHSLNFSAIYTPTVRGRSAPVTEEVLELKGATYNPYWGFQNGEIRNSRMKEVKEPILMLNHFWKLKENLDLNTNLSYQFGEISNSRIDYGGTSQIDFEGQQAFFGQGVNPDPVYYQKLPSYFLRFDNNQDFERAFRARLDLVENGQLDWNQLYDANRTSNYTNATYVVAEDVNSDQRLDVNSILTWFKSDHLKITGSMKYSEMKSQNFGRIKDLLGAEGFLDIDVFSENAQTNLIAPNRIVSEGERYKYDYNITSDDLEAFSQIQFSRNKMELSLAGKVGSIAYVRTGNFQNGSYPENSFGSSEETNFLEYGLRAGAIYKFSGRQNLEINLASFKNAPTAKNIFVNPRQNNEIVPGIAEELLISGDLTYRYRTQKFSSRFTAFFSEIRNATEVSYYYTDGLSGLGRENNTAFVQEILTDLDKRFLGIEVGLDYQVTSTIKLKAASGLGQYTFANNPNVQLASSSFREELDYGKAYLKDYRLAGGPQNAIQVGFEYRDPEYWWFGATLNYFSNAFIDINPLTRTTNFQKDYDGLSLVEYDPVEARRLLEQEKFDSYFLTNLIGGKSWRIKDKNLGFFLSINNLFDEFYKSGGFEQARNANYRTLKEDRDRQFPIFGNKYWFGNGTSFFANVNLRF